MLFLIILAVTSLLQVRLTPGAGDRHEARRSRRCCVNGWRWSLGARCVALFPLLWMVSVSFMPPGEASTLPAAAAAARRRRSRTTARCSRGSASGGTSLNSLLIALRRHRAVAAASTSIAGYAFAKLRFAGRERVFRLLLGALSSRRRWRCCRCS